MNRPPPCNQPGQARLWLLLLAAVVLTAASTWRLTSADPSAPARSIGTVAPPSLTADRSSSGPSSVSPDRDTVERQLDDHVHRPAAETDEAGIALLVVQLAQWDPHLAADYAEHCLGSPHREQTLKAVVSRWVATEPDAVLRWISSRKDQKTRDTALRALMPILARQDAEAAAQLVAALDAGPLRDDVLGQAIAAWASADLPQAAAWVEQSPAHLKEAARLHLTEFWSQTDPPGAARYAASLPPGPGRIRLMSTTASQWTRADPIAAMTWATQLSDAAARHPVLASATAAWAETAPEVAVTFAISLPPGATQREATISAVSAWAHRNPAQAAPWVAGLPAGATRRYALKAVASQWARTDHVAAGAWLATLPAGRERDAGIQAAAAILIEQQPDVVARWIEAIEDHALRHTQMAVGSSSIPRHATQPP